MTNLDLHNKSVIEAIKEVEFYLKRENILLVITGYGSKTNKCKIRNKLIEYLDELKKDKKINCYFSSNLTIFNSDYLNLKESKRKEIRKYVDNMNPGMILIVR